MVKQAHSHNPELTRVLELVDRTLAERFGDQGYLRWGAHAFMRVQDGAVVFLVVSDLDDGALLNVRCYAVRDVERPDAELGDYLARLNADLLFGTFSLDEDSDVCCDYSVLGAGVTPEVVDVAVHAVAAAVRRFAEPIITRWGGITSLDKLRMDLDADLDDGLSGESAPN